METSSELDKITPAMFKCHHAMGQAKFNQKANYGEYADLKEVMRVIKMATGENDLFFTQSPGRLTQSEQSIALTTRIFHKSGQWIEGTIELPLGKITPQNAGGAITYARRYSLCSMFGVFADADDDAQSSQPGKQKPPSAGTPTQPIDDFF